jgi:hypothetical protein
MAKDPVLRMATSSLDLALILLGALLAAWLLGPGTASLS